MVPLRLTKGIATDDEQAFRESQFDETHIPDLSILCLEVVYYREIVSYEEDISVNQIDISPKMKNL